MKLDIAPPRLVMIIVNKSGGQGVTELLNAKGFETHAAFLGRGTAPSELSTVLGLGEPEKTIIMFGIQADKVRGLFGELEEKLGIGAGLGIAFTIPMNAASNMKVLKLVLGF